MSLRQYAAIKLRVPDSGLPWLDVMIEKSSLNQLAEAALGGLTSNPEFLHEIAKMINGDHHKEEGATDGGDSGERVFANGVASAALILADAMLKERGK